eukprot:c1386_g1_i1.p1 GENE.c1386_g1_i1~~c1386_g1_i1.p1  ORF type:complete len:436 (+),score=55.95 c1386_g1_i1:129-1436(+)
MAHRTWSADKVAAWLTVSGFDDMVSMFDENDIDGAALILLTHDLLKEMGLTKVGPRTKLLKAIAELNGEPAPASPAGPASASAPSAGGAAASPAASPARPLAASRSASTATVGALEGRDEHESRDVRRQVARAQSKPSSAGVIRAGFLSKEGGRRKSWKRRWFTLENMVLSYYKTEGEVGEKDPLGRIPIPSYEVDLDNKKRNGFKISHPGCRTFYFSADTPEERDGWMRAIRESGLATASRSWFNAQAAFFAIEYDSEADIFSVTMAMDAPEVEPVVEPGKTYRFHVRVRKPDGYTAVVLDAARTGLVVRDANTLEVVSAALFTSVQRYTVALQDPIFSFLQVQGGTKTVHSFHMGNFAVARYVNAVVTAHITEIAQLVVSMRPTQGAAIGATPVTLGGAAGGAGAAASPLPESEDSDSGSSTTSSDDTDVSSS